MHLKDIKPRVFAQTLEHLREFLNDGSDAVWALLDEAREDTPLIDQTIWQMQLILEKPEDPQRRRMLDRAERDLLVFLTLRQLEKDPEAAPRVRRQPTGARSQKN